MLSLAIDNTNTNRRGGETPAMIPVETATETQKRLLVSTDHLNSQALSVPADAAGGGSPSSTVTGTHSHSTGATVEAETTTSQAVSAAHSTRPASFDGSGDEPSVPSFADGGAKMRDCNRAGRGDESAEAKQVATNSEPHGLRSEVDA